MFFHVYFCVSLEILSIDIRIAMTATMVHTEKPQQLLDGITITGIHGLQRMTPTGFGDPLS